MSKKFKLAYFVSHPIQYQAPLLKDISTCPDIDLTVFFLSDISTREYYDTGFKRFIKWDVELLDGYKHVFLPVIKRKHSSLGFFSPINYNYLHYLDNEWDAVWVHGYASLTLNIVILYCIFRKIPLFFRGESIKEATGKFLLKNLYLRFIFRRVARFLYVSSKNKQYYLSFNVPEKKLYFTPYCVNNKNFELARLGITDDQVSSFKVDNNIPLKTPVLLFLSKLIPRKNPFLLLQVVHKLIKEGYNLHLLLVGDGPQKNIISDYINHNSLHEFVTIHGFSNQSQLPIYYSCADIFILPSVKEPFGLVIPEAMNFALPIITSSEVGCSNDLVFNDLNGYILDHVDFNSLFTAISTMLESKSKLKSFGNHSLEIISNWSYDSDLNEILNALRSL